jgi:ketosteroid isomerase-like protein
MDDREIRERNARTVEAFYEAERARDLAKWETFWHENGRITLRFSGDPAPTVGRAALVELTRRKFEIRPPYRMDVSVEPLVDPSLVLARNRLHLKDSVVSTLDLWCMFHFDDDGLITEVEEIADGSAGPVFPE